MRLVLSSLGLLVVLSSTALAQDRPDRQAQVQRRPGRPPVIVVPAIVIEGKVDRPQAFVVLPRPQVTYQWPELQRERPAPAEPPAP